MTPQARERELVDASATSGMCLQGPSESCRAELGWGLAMINRSFAQWAAASVADLPGGPRGHLVLATISRGRPASQLALANELGVDRTVMTYLLDELEHAGLLERRRDPADRRARQVLITAAGTCALLEYRARLDAAEAQLLAPLDADEAATLRTLVERVARVAQASLAAPPNPCSEPA